MKKAIIIILIIIVLIIAAIFSLMYMMKKPLYKPGMVRDGKNLRAPLSPPEQPANGNYWLVEKDIKLHHFSVGKGKNILIVHGGPGSPFVKPWIDLDPLTKNYKLHYYDQRGCGKSTRPIDKFESKNYFQNVKTLDQTQGLGAQIADIERIRRILGEEKLIIISHSWGAFLASLYAAEFPENVKAMILIAPADTLIISQDEGGGIYEGVKSRLPRNKHAEFDDFMKRYFNFKNIFSKTEAELAALNNEFGDYFISIMNNPPSKSMRINEAKATGGWMVFAMYFSMGMQHDYRDALKNVKAPVLVIHNGDDLQTEERSRVYADAFPNSQFEVIEGVEHFFYNEQAGKFADLLKKFLNENAK